MKNKIFTLEELAILTGSRLVGDPKSVICDVADLETATAQDASFLANPRYEQAMRQSRAGVVFVDGTVPLIAARNFLIHENPSLAFQKLVEMFHPPQEKITGFEGIHPTAVIHKTSKIGKDVTIGPYAVIDAGASIGDCTTIGAGSYIGSYTAVGNDCYVHPHVVIRERCSIGNRVILQPGVVVGSCGFGYTTDKQGRHTKLNQIGNVIIHDDVEIGAQTTIDRARFKTTTIGRGTKIDNLVQIGHGVVIGEDNIIVAQTGIAGSTVTGRNVVLAGQVAVAGHIKLGDGVVVSARSGVSKSLLQPGRYGGVPALSLDEYNRNSVFLRNIEKYVEQIKELQQRIHELEKTN